MLEWPWLAEWPPEPPELVLLEDTLDTDITECGRLIVLQDSGAGPAIELRNLGAAAKVEKKRKRDG